MDKTIVLESITKVVHECGEDMLTSSINSLKINTKTSNRDVVTEKDLSNQNRIINHLSHEFPEAGFISEEIEGNTFPSNELVFIIDPIDGTMNFTKDMGYSCVSVACFKNQKPYVGVVYNPYRDELFTATLGGGAFCNGNLISVTNESLSNSLIQTNTSSYYPELRDETITRVQSILPKCINIRMAGAAALDICQVAAGRAGLYFEARISLWDYAAAALILTEAGGEVLDLKGNPISYNLEKTSIIAGPRNNIDSSELING